MDERLFITPEKVEEVLRAVFPEPDAGSTYSLKWMRFMMELKCQSDRGAAIISGAYVESKLKMALKWKLADKEVLSKKHEKTGNTLFPLLFDDYNSAPLGTFSGKIRMAYALDLIGPHTYSDLMVIKDIRNDFAHEFEIEDSPHEAVTFSQQSIKDKCALLWHPSNSGDVFDGEAVEPPDIPRDRFTFSVTTIGHRIEFSRLNPEMLR